MATTSRPSPSEVMPCGPCSSSTASRTATAQLAAHRLLRVLDHLAQQARAVFQAAAIFVGPRRCCAATGTGTAGSHARHRHRRCRSRRAWRASPPRAASRERRGCRPCPWRARRGRQVEHGRLRRGRRAPASRVMRLLACAPPCQSSTAARLPCAWMASAVSASALHVVLVPQASESR